jgi:plastocyanin
MVVSLPMAFPLRLLGLASMAFFLLPAGLRAQATITGHVELPKARTAPVIIKRYEVVTKGDVVSTNPPLAVVYLEGPFPRPANPSVRQMAQKDLTFEPALLAIQVGTKVEFANLDDTYHDVFSFSPAKRFDLGRYRPEVKPVPSQVFDTAGLVTLRCDIHEHMRALVLVLDTPHFVLTDAQGNYELKNAPAGKYTLKAWVDSRTTLEHPVDVPRSGTLRTDFP